MKRSLLTLASALALCLSAYAAPQSVAIGYCSSTDELNGDYKHSGNDVNTSAALLLPEHLLKAYAGAQISGIKAGLQSKLHVDRLTVWVRSSLEGENLVEETVDATTTPALKKGWNELTFSKPLAIPSDVSGGLYIGYTIHQTGIAYAIANNSYPSQDGFLVNLGGEGWANHSEEGTLCIKGILTGENLPEVNLSMNFLEIDPTFYIEDNLMKGKLRIHNFGTKKVTKFDLAVMADGSRVCLQPRQVGIDPGKTADMDILMAPGFTESGKYTFSLEAVNIAEGEDADPADNAMDFSLNIIEKPLMRTVLVEEFTTAMCSNCPSAAQKLSAIAARDDYQGRLAIVCHHAGYYTDQFTTDFDENYLWFYNDGGRTYAPAFMMDRDSFGTSTPVIGPGNLERNIAIRMEEQTFLKLEAQAGFDKDDQNKLYVSIKGTKYQDKLCDTPVLTVYVVENGLVANQAGAGTKYTHNHVNRDVNYLWGVPVEFDGNTFTYNHTFDLDSKWNRNNLEIVAFVHNFNDAKPTDWEVQNAVTVSRSEFLTNMTGVSGVEVDDDVEIEYYTLDGVRVDQENLVQGIYVRRHGTRADKVIIR